MIKPIRIVGLFCLLVMMPVEAASTEKVLIAHRGASAYAPEHTRMAYEMAIRQGADFVEQDLQVTRDGFLVCLHDSTLERTTDVEEKFPERFRVSEKGDREWWVRDFTLEEIKSLDAGTWFDERFADLKVLTFREAIELIAGRAGLYPETKAPDSYLDDGHRMEQLLMEELVRSRLASPNSGTPVVIQSFSQASLLRLRQEFSCELPLTLLLSDRTSPERLTSDSLREIARFADGIGPSKQLIENDPDLVGRAHRQGLSVTPYTFRSRSVPAPFEDVHQEMRHFLFQWRVDALFTDNPDLFPRSAR